MIFPTDKCGLGSLIKSSHCGLRFYRILLILFSLYAIFGTISQAQTKLAVNDFFSPVTRNVFGSSSFIGDFNKVKNNSIASANTDSAQITAISNGIYQITAKHSGKALEVSNSSTDNGAPVQQWDYANSNNQKWTVEPLGDGTYKLTVLSSGKALDVSENSNLNGARVHQWDYVNGDNQKWRIESVGNGYYKVIAKHSGKALDISGVSYSNGAAVIQWDYVGGDNQLWQFNLISDSPQTSRVPARYKLVLDDEFGQAELDTSKWFTRYIYAGGYLDYLNDEEQRYRENGNHVMNGSSLRLTAKLDTSGGTRYTSGMIRSKMTFKYGYFEGRFKFPKGRGIWPAFWLNSDGQTDSELSWPPEIDIFEYVVNGTTEHPNMIHTGVINYGAQGNTILAQDPAFNTQWNFYPAPVDLSDDWHVVALLWDTDDTVTTYLDGKLIVKRATRWVRNSGADATNAHLLINFALGGGWAGPVDDSQLPSFLEVDYIRVYQKQKMQINGRATIGSDLCPPHGC